MSVKYIFCGCLVAQCQHFHYLLKLCIKVSDLPLRKMWKFSVHAKVDIFHITILKCDKTFPGWIQHCKFHSFARKFSIKLHFSTLFIELGRFVCHWAVSITGAREFDVGTRKCRQCEQWSFFSVFSAPKWITIISSHRSRWVLLADTTFLFQDPLRLRSACSEEKKTL